MEHLKTFLKGFSVVTLGALFFMFLFSLSENVIVSLVFLLFLLMFLVLCYLIGLLLES